MYELKGGIDTYCFGPLRLVTSPRILLRGNEIVPLSERLVAVLIVLVERHDRIVTKEEIIAAVWGGRPVEERNLTVLIAALRKKLSADLGGDFIATVARRGYKFMAVVRLTQNAVPEPLAPSLLGDPRPVYHWSDGAYGHPADSSDTGAAGHGNPARNSLENTDPEAPGDHSEEPEYHFGPFQLLPRRLSIMRHGEVVRLGHRALSILIVLVEHHDRIVTKEEIVATVWGDIVVEDRNLPVQISVLRAKLGEDLGDNFIATIPGLGYRFTAAVIRLRGAAPQPDPTLVEAAGDATDGKIKTNLPRGMSAIIGRAAELQELQDLIAPGGLVTLTGPGGVGKTRLALALGWRIQSIYPDGVWLVDLAPLRAPALVASTAAAVLGVPLHSGGADAATIAGSIAKRHLLLLLDNCEHLHRAAAELIAALRDRAPGVSVLVTTQEILRLPAETVYHVGPLEVPPVTAADIMTFAAVQLFVARAHAADRRFVLKWENDRGVAEICRRLDGNPLALEMAAARWRFLGIEGLRAGLSQRLRLFGGGGHATPWRHGTLQRMVVWSYGLLDPGEQRVFRMLGIFTGSFSLESALAVVGEHDGDRIDKVDALGRLVDKSLISVEGGESPRYRLLETLRLHAIEMLEAAGEADQAAKRHAEHVTAMFLQAYKIWPSTLDSTWVQTYQSELDNVRAAMNWALADPGRAPIAIALAGLAARLWEHLSLFSEAWHYVNLAIGVLGPDTDSPSAARLLVQAASLYYRSDRPRALAFAERSLAFYQEIGDEAGIADSQSVIGHLHVFTGRYEEARRMLGNALRLFSQGGHTKSLFGVMNNLGILESVENKIDQAKLCYLRALDLARMLKDVNRQNQILFNLAELNFQLGAVDFAIEQSRAAIAGMRPNPRECVLGWALINLSCYLVVRSDWLEARAAAIEALSLLREEGGFPLMLCLQQLALIGAHQGKLEMAARLIGFVNAGFSASGYLREPTEQQTYDLLQTILAGALASTEIQRLMAEGAASTDTLILISVDKAILPP